MGNENSTTSKTRELPAKAASNSVEPKYGQRKLGRRSTTKETRMVDLGLYTEQNGKQLSLVNDDDTFTNYIHRAKRKLRSFSNVGQRREEISNDAPDVANNNAPVGNSNTKDDDDHIEHFSNFIQRTRNKLRTVSRVGNNGSFRRG